MLITSVLIRDRLARMHKVIDASDLKMHGDMYEQIIKGGQNPINEVENIISELEARMRLAQQEKSYLLGDLGEI